MKKLKWIILILSATVVFISILGCSSKPKTYTHGDWVIVHQGENECLVYDVSKQGYEKEVLIFPTEVDGRKVVGVYYKPSGMFHDGHSVIAPNLERLYFTDYVYIDSLAIHRGFKILYLFNVKYETVLHYWHSFIFPEIDYLNLCSCCFPANVVYRYNYDGALQKNYWLDDYDNEVVKYPPAAPVRDGYEFAGWYKEPECINKWNFETDKLPMDFSGAHNPEPSVKLYAKWIKK